MTEAAETQPAPQGAAWKDGLATLGTVLGLLVSGAVLSNSVFAALQARVDRLEQRAHEAERDTPEVLQRIRGLEVRTGENTRILHRLENRLEGWMGPWRERHR